MNLALTNKVIREFGGRHENEAYTPGKEGVFVAQ